MTPSLLSILLGPQIVEGRQVFAHKVVLALGSDKFRAMFTLGFKESSSREIEIPDTSYDVFVALVEQLYTGTLPRLKSSGGEAKDFEFAVELLQVRAPSASSPFVLRVSFLTYGVALRRRPMSICWTAFESNVKPAWQKTCVRTPYRNFGRSRRARTRRSCWPCVSTLLALHMRVPASSGLTVTNQTCRSRPDTMLSETLVVKWKVTSSLIACEELLSQLNMGDMCFVLRHHHRTNEHTANKRKETHTELQGHLLL